MRRKKDFLLKFMWTYFDNMKMNITFAVALRGKLTWWHKWFTLILILRIFTPYSPLRCFSVFGINTKRFVGFYVLSLLMILSDADITTIYTWILVMREVRICEDVHFHFLSPHILSDFDELGVSLGIKKQERRFATSLLLLPRWSAKSLKTHISYQFLFLALT